jgi:pyruvate-ferredoxin/flavodoxin oxidoreductase
MPADSPISTVTVFESDAPRRRRQIRLDRQGGRQEGPRPFGDELQERYVAQIALGANPAQTLKVFHEAESYPGPSLILAYSHCAAHGINMAGGVTHQKDVVQSGLWPLFRFDPRLTEKGQPPFHIDSRPPSVEFSEFAKCEGRFAMATSADPERAEQLFADAQDDINERWRFYEHLASYAPNGPSE